jgi:hypothetical protein
VDGRWLPRGDKALGQLGVERSHRRHQGLRESFGGLPVGAQSLTLSALPVLRKRATKVAAMANVLPVPGPPETTRVRWWKRRSAISRCWAESVEDAKTRSTSSRYRRLRRRLTRQFAA